MKKHMVYNTEILEDEISYYEENHPEYSEQERWECCCEDKEITFNFLCDELDRCIPNGIIAITDLGLWNGRKAGYKEIGNNLKDCLYASCDSAEWYVDNYGRFCSVQHHHDGTNYLIYKAWKDNISDRQKETCIDLILSGKATPTILTRYTRNIGKVIADIYGWKVK